ALGEGDKELARRLATNTLVFGVLLSVVFVGIGWLNLPYLAGLLGATGETLELSVLYLSIIIPSLPLLVTGVIGSAILRAHGDARRAMMATVIGGVVNAVLDPILIFGFGLDLTGAALASVAARIAIGLAALYPVIRFYGGLHMPRPGALLRDAGPILTIAFPAMLTQLATPIGQAYVTRSMAVYGEDAVSGMAIIGRLTPVAFGVVFALSGAIGPIIGQNFGARKYDRVRRAYLDGVLFTAAFVIVMSALLFLLRVQIAALFQADGLSRELIFLFCGPLALVFFFNGLIFVSNAAFNNLGWPFYSTWISWGRNTLGTIPLVLLGGYFWGAPGVLIGQAAGGLVFGIFAAWLALRVIRGSAKPAAAPTDGFRRQARLLQLFHNRR
ncbi:MAG: MATE family efflux transporter, partial [Paracoccaceae bacterium]